MYAVANKKSLRLVYGTFNIVIFTGFVTFYEDIRKEDAEKGTATDIPLSRR